VTTTRRELFGLLRPRRAEAAVEAPADEEVAPTPAPPVDTGFSLDRFYAGRGGGGDTPSAIPHFAVRTETPVPTSRIGTGLTGRAQSRAPGDARVDVTPIPPALVPRVLAHACIALTSFCTVCSERCPVPGAIVMTAGRPAVVPAACDGCGRCVATCPAPVLGFELVRRSDLDG
jgi:ferredoxin